MGKRGLARAWTRGVEYRRATWTTGTSILKKVETGIKDAAKTVEDFADEVAAPKELVRGYPRGGRSTEASGSKAARAHKSDLRNSVGFP